MADELLLTTFSTTQVNAVEVLQGGLAGIPVGLDRMENNLVSKLKLVVRPHDTL
jgi:hypothetical protein